MRIAVALFFMLLLSKSFSQDSCNVKSKYENETAESLLGPLPNVWKQETSHPLLQWKVRPQSIHIRIFSRWGKLLHESWDPDDFLDPGIFNLNKGHLHEFELFFYFFEIRACSGKLIEIKGAAHVGWYEMCG